MVFRLAPIGREEVQEMISKLKRRALLEGFRGTTPINRNLLADWLIRMGELACRVEAVQEIDINPLLIVKGEPIAVDATIILR